MISWINTPFEDVIQSVKNLYGDIYCEIVIDSQLKEEEGIYGYAQWTDDGSVIVALDGKTEIETQVETLAHELAHVVIGKENINGHCDKWEKVLDDIYIEYERYCKEKYVSDK